MEMLERLPIVEVVKYSVTVYLIRNWVLMLHWCKRKMTEYVIYV